MDKEAKVINLLKGLIVTGDLETLKSLSSIIDAFVKESEDKETLKKRIEELEFKLDLLVGGKK